MEIKYVIYDLDSEGYLINLEEGVRMAAIIASNL